MKKLGINMHSRFNLYSKPSVTTSAHDPATIHIYLGGVSLFVDSDTRNALALALVQHMYDTDGADRDTLDSIAHLAAVMSDNSAYEAAMSDTLYDQFVDDAITGA